LLQSILLLKIMCGQYWKKLPAVLFLVLIFVFSSCQDKDDNNPNRILDPNEKVNTWVKDVMDDVYLWLEQMRPGIAKTSDPEDFFESLLNRPTDRFSVIYPDYQELMNQLQGVNLEAGYEILLARESETNNNIIAFVTYVKKGSPAELAGVKRGDRIERINGERLTFDSYIRLLGKMSENHSITFFRYNDEAGAFQAVPAVSLSVTEISEDPNFLDTVYHINNEKIGYVVYHFFAPGTNNRYDNRMDQIFAGFQAEGIDHLILDFRYNGGGFVSSAINLASLIAPNVTGNDVFSKRLFNSFLMQFDDFQNVETNFRSKSENIGSLLKGNRVYIITSRRTASASELIINGLKPYMDVVVVGDITTGKNVGSIPLEDEEDPDNTYGLLPIIFKDANKNGESEFSNGFIPNIQGIELRHQNRLLPFGDTNELLLKLALDRIQGTQQAGARLETFEIDVLGSSIESKLNYGKMVDDNPSIKAKLRQHK
jgi:carboxyl-terminal processing protease